MIEKLRHYLLGSNSTVYTNNNPLIYVQGSNLGMAQIQWFSELALFDFDIKYRCGKSNQAADALSHCPKANNDNSTNSDSEEHETILYAVACDDLCAVIKGEKSSLHIKIAVQEEMTKQLPDSEKISAHSEMMGILSKVTPEMMKEAQEEDIDISKTIHYIKSGKKTTLCSDTKNEIKTCA